MAQIIYQPHCSECGEVISDEVVYRTIIKDYGSNLLKEELVSIEPLRCRTCGNMFESIVITPPREECDGE